MFSGSSALADQLYQQLHLKNNESLGKDRGMKSWESEYFQSGTVLFGLKMKPHPHYIALYYAFIYHLSKYTEAILDIYYCSIFIKTWYSN